MRTSNLARLTGVVVAGALLTAACSGGPPDLTVSPTESFVEPTAPASAEPSEAPTATADPPATDAPTETAAPPTDAEPPTDEAPFVADRADDTEDVSGDAFLSPVGLRFGVHDGYDRVVLDLEGTGLPGWVGGYDSDPRMAGSGDPVDLDGSAYLVIHVRGLVYPTEEGAVEFSGSTRLETAAGGVVREVVYGGVFEGQAEVFIGLDSDQPFRVFRLEDPARVAIDVLHP